MQDTVAQSDLLTLQEAADHLKVHYMTAYRWVRKGQLPAFKAGGRLRVQVSDVERFLSERQVDVALPTPHLGRTDWTTHVDRLHRLLVEGHGVEAGSLVRKVVADGAPAGEVYLQLITPALHLVGDDWAAGRVTVAVEHRSTEIASALLARLGEFFRRRGPSRGVAVTLTLPGEQHALACAMVADFLRAGGYDVHHLGPNVPIDELRLFLQMVPTDVVCVSVTCNGLGSGLYDRLVAAAARCVVVVGGQGASPADVEAAGGLCLDDLAQLMPRLDALTRHSQIR